MPGVVSDVVPGVVPSVVPERAKNVKHTTIRELYTYGKMSAVSLLDYQLLLGIGNDIY